MAQSTAVSPGERTARGATTGAAGYVVLGAGAALAAIAAVVAVFTPPALGIPVLAAALAVDEMRTAAQLAQTSALAALAVDPIIQPPGPARLAPRACTWSTSC